MTMALELRDELLPNGVRLITEHNPASLSMSFGFWVNVGSRDEGAELEGGSHFLEHLLFKGTPTRSAGEISSVIENLGGYMNAFTDRDMTTYIARTRAKDQSIATEVLSDMLQNSVLDPKDVEMERQVILEEIKRVQDDPESLIHELYTKNIWKGNRAAHSITGTFDTISKMSVESIKDYYNENYGKVIAVAAGAVDHEKMANDLTSFIQKGLGKSSKNRVKPEHLPGKNIVERDSGQVQLAIAYPGVHYGHDDGAAITILSSYLGVGSSGKLFQEVREKRGLVYSILAYNQSLEDVGAFVVLAGTSKQNVGEVVEVTMNELESLKQGLAPDVLETVKQKTIGMFILGSESNQRRMHQIGVSTLRLDNPRTVDEIVKLLEAVTVEDIARVADRTFNINKMSLTALGMSDADSEGLEKYFS
ncbi:MAG: M16 family metallopeptidase [Candidatus Bathyarchaeota archaeon]